MEKQCQINNSESSSPSKEYTIDNDNNDKNVKGNNSKPNEEEIMYIKNKNIENLNIDLKNINSRSSININKNINDNENKENTQNNGNMKNDIEKINNCQSNNLKIENQKNNLKNNCSNSNTKNFNIKNINKLNETCKINECELNNDDNEKSNDKVDNMDIDLKDKLLNTIQKENKSLNNEMEKDETKTDLATENNNICSNCINKSNEYEVLNNDKVNNYSINIKNMKSNEEKESNIVKEVYIENINKNILNSADENNILVTPTSATTSSKITSVTSESDSTINSNRQQNLEISGNGTLERTENKCTCKENKLHNTNEYKNSVIHEGTNNIQSINNFLPYYNDDSMAINSNDSSLLLGDLNNDNIQLLSSSLINNNYNGIFSTNSLNSTLIPTTILGNSGDFVPMTSETTLINHPLNNITLFPTTTLMDDPNIVLPLLSTTPITTTMSLVENSNELQKTSVLPTELLIEDPNTENILQIQQLQQTSTPLLDDNTNNEISLLASESMIENLNTTNVPLVKKSPLKNNFIDELPIVNSTTHLNNYENEISLLTTTSSLENNNEMSLLTTNSMMNNELSLLTTTSSLVENEDNSIPYLQSSLLLDNNNSVSSSDKNNTNQLLDSSYTTYENSESLLASLSNSMITNLTSSAGSTPIYSNNIKVENDMNISNLSEIYKSMENSDITQVYPIKEDDKHMNFNSIVSTPVMRMETSPVIDIKNDTFNSTVNSFSPIENNTQNCYCCNSNTEAEVLNIKNDLIDNNVISRYIKEESSSNDNNIITSTSSMFDSLSKTLYSPIQATNNESNININVVNPSNTIPELGINKTINEKINNNVKIEQISPSLSQNSIDDCGLNQNDLSKSIYINGDISDIIINSHTKDNEIPIISNSNVVNLAELSSHHGRKVLSNYPQYYQKLNIMENPNKRYLNKYLYQNNFENKKYLSSTIFNNRNNILKKHNQTMLPILHEPLSNAILKDETDLTLENTNVKIENDYSSYSSALLNEEVNDNATTIDTSLLLLNRCNRNCNNCSCCNNKSFTAFTNIDYENENNLSPQSNRNEINNVYEKEWNSQPSIDEYENNRINLTSSLNNLMINDQWNYENENKSRQSNENNNNLNCIMISDENKIYLNDNEEKNDETVIKNNTQAQNISMNSGNHNLSNCNHYNQNYKDIYKSGIVNSNSRMMLKRKMNYNDINVPIQKCINEKVGINEMNYQSDYQKNSLMKALTNHSEILNSSSPFDLIDNSVYLLNNNIYFQKEYYNNENTNISKGITEKDYLYQNKMNDIHRCTCHENKERYLYENNLRNNNLNIENDTKLNNDSQLENNINKLRSLDQNKQINKISFTKQINNKGKIQKKIIKEHKNMKREYELLNGKTNKKLIKNKRKSTLAKSIEKNKSRIINSMLSLPYNSFTNDKSNIERESYNVMNSSEINMATSSLPSPLLLTPFNTPPVFKNKTSSSEKNEENMEMLNLINSSSTPKQKKAKIIDHKLISPVTPSSYSVHTTNSIYNNNLVNYFMSPNEKSSPYSSSSSVSSPYFMNTKSIMTANKQVKPKKKYNKKEKEIARLIDTSTNSGLIINNNNNVKATTSATAISSANSHTTTELATNIKTNNTPINSSVITTTSNTIINNNITNSPISTHSSNNIINNTTSTTTASTSTTLSAVSIPQTVSSISNININSATKSTNQSKNVTHSELLNVKKPKTTKKSLKNTSALKKKELNSSSLSTKLNNTTQNKNYQTQEKKISRKIPIPRITLIPWIDQNTYVFQVEIGDKIVSRRFDNHLVNGTKLLNVAGLTRGKRDAILKNEQIRDVVKNAPFHLKGVWISIERARELSYKYNIDKKINYLLDNNPTKYIDNPDIWEINNWYIYYPKRYKRKY